MKASWLGSGEQIGMGRVEEQHCQLLAVVVSAVLGQKDWGRFPLAAPVGPGRLPRSLSRFGADSSAPAPSNRFNNDYVPLSRTTVMQAQGPTLNGGGGYFIRGRGAAWRILGGVVQHPLPKPLRL